MHTIKLNSNLENEAIKIFKNYGLSLDEGIKLLLDNFVYKKLNFLDLDIELVNENDPDYKLMQEAKKTETISIEEFMKLW